MYIVIDCETTGLKPESNVLTLCYLILDKELKEIDRLSLKIKHERYNICEKAMRINKIDIIEHDRDGISISECDKETNEFLKKNKIKDLILIGHNVNFDINMLKTNKIIVDEKYISRNIIDTKIIAEFYKSIGKIPLSINTSLIELCKYYKLSEGDENFHDAEYDVLKTIELLKRIRKV